MHRLVERVARMIAVQVRPECREQGVPLVKAAPSVDREVGEEGKALRLDHDGMEHPAVRGTKVHTTERGKLNHDAPSGSR